MEDLRTAIGEFISERDWEQFHSPKNLAMALSVEVAEIVEHFQWLSEEQSRNLSPEKVAEVRPEIGDVMIYLAELAGKLGVDPVEATKAKLEINKQKYPAALAKGKAHKYVTSYLGSYFAPDGKRRYVSAKTKTACREKLRRAMSDADHGLVFDAGTLTLGKYLDK